MLLYNQIDELSLQQLQQNTEIKTEILTQILTVLLKIKILTTTDPNWKDGTLSSDAVLKLNQNYNNKKLRININVPIKAEAREDDERTHKQIDDSRKYVIEVCLQFNSIILKTNY
jgi:cullin 1